MINIAIPETCQADAVPSAILEPKGTSHAYLKAHRGEYHGSLVDGIPHIVFGVIDFQTGVGI